MTARFINGALGAGRRALGFALAAFAFCFLCNSPVAAQDVPLSDNDILAAPQLPAYQWFASTDPQHKNADYIELKPGETKRVPLAAGQLLRLWSTAFEPDKIALAVDNGRRGRWPLLKDGKAQHGKFFKKAYIFYPFSDGKNAMDNAGYTLTPLRDLKKGAALVATNHSKQPNKWFYQVTVGAATAPPPPTVGGNRFAIRPQTLKIGDEAVLFEATTAGVIKNIRFDLAPTSLKRLRGLRLQAHWAEGELAALDVPLSVLIGQFFDVAPAQSAAFEIKTSSVKTSVVLRWPMPFDRGAHLSLVNAGNSPIEVLGGDITTDGNSSPYRFCARFGSARTQKGQPLEILKVNGAGAFVGLAMGIAPASDSARRTFAYLEGNETLIADGHKYEGTGTEDFFNSAWYFPDKPFSQPFGGMTFKSKEPPRVSMYRLMIADAVPFRQNFEFQFEHGNGNNSNDLEYSWAAFWYQKPPLNFEIEDQLSQPAAGGSTPLPSNWGEPLILSALGFGLLVVILGFVAWRARKRKL